MRWSLVSMIAYTILAVTTARGRGVIPASAEAKLIPLTARETAHPAASPRPDLAPAGSRPRPALVTVATPAPAPSRVPPSLCHWNEVTAAVMT